MSIIAAADMARDVGVDPKRFRRALRSAHLPWHEPDASWSVERESPEHEQMMQVLESLRSPLKPSDQKPAQQRSSGKARGGSDEHYIVGLCDKILGEKALRGHRFDFLRGDAGANETGRPLPVDAYYPALKLVIEYCERQHSEPVAFFDRRPTVSGVGRGDQRKIYDQRRRDVLPEKGIALIELHFSDFAHDTQKRLLRQSEDYIVLRRRLMAYLKAKS